MGSIQIRRPSYDLGSRALPCHNQRSRRLCQRRLYRTSIFIAVVMFVGFQFSVSTQLEPWPDKVSFNTSDQNSSLKAADGSPANVPQESDEYKEGILDKIEYGIIKFFMSKIVAAHLRRQKAAAALMSSQETPPGAVENEQRIQRKPLSKMIDNSRNGETNDYEYTSNSTHSTDRDSQQTFGNSTNTSFDASQKPKVIVLYTRFFGRRNWTGIFGNSSDFEAHSCPVSNCVITNDRSRANQADALIFHARDFRAKGIPRSRKPHQRYIWLYHEAPGMENADLSEMPDGFFNWTYTYQRDSDLLLLYGGVEPIQGGKPQNYNITRPGLLDRADETYREYLIALGQATDLPESPGPQGEIAVAGAAAGAGAGAVANANTSEKKLIAWMVSHCNTWSGRELYVQELMQYVDVDVYGKCGSLTCGKTHHDSFCYSDVLGPNYKFYLAFENSLCNDYLTEKVWYPLHYGLVPIVYGGARYQDFLPPHSYIDATDMAPKQLASLIIKLGSNDRLYNQYHLWRSYWRVMVPPPMCELCQRLHEDHTPSTVQNPQKWWKEVNNCTTHYSFEEYPRQDLRLIVSKVDMGIKLFRRMISSFF